ncbi:rhodanese-like domain-containing protein [Gilvimarinus sp. DA14]|uniref:rhodanese-like domain-containing protein n=1 Tax=Gilvimarinus sp. DA14 TaxID=2956798 RepID=UPI0020B86381|nr:rhodanese-like domain-containing protein [Gilvimarinus sp. DA14]UTF60558.1 rhodanese-like domain-containing protein [Gilvimarinus sp. DA14]
MKRKTLQLLTLLALGFGSMLASAEDILWVDVRTPAEYSSAHLDGALNIPHDRIEAGIAELEIAKDQRIVLYCRSGRRADIAMDALQALGYTEVENAVNLQGAKALRDQSSASSESQY